MTPDLAAIRERAEKATEGPWTIAQSEILQAPRIMSESPYEGQVAIAGEPDSGIWNCDGGDDCYVWRDETRNDADFIAHARQDIPALLDYIEQLKAAGDELAVWVSMVAVGGIETNRIAVKNAEADLDEWRSLTQEREEA